MEIKERFGNDGGRCSIKYLKDGSGKLGMCNPFFKYTIEEVQYKILTTFYIF